LRSRTGGVFFTNATRFEERSEAFLKTFELLTQSRTIDRLDALLEKLPWRNFKLVRDKTGLQTYACYDMNSVASPDQFRDTCGLQISPSARFRAQ